MHENDKCTQSAESVSCLVLLRFDEPYNISTDIMIFIECSFRRMGVCWERLRGGRMRDEAMNESSVPMRPNSYLLGIHWSLQ